MCYSGYLQVKSTHLVNSWFRLHRDHALIWTTIVMVGTIDVIWLKWRGISVSLPPTVLLILAFLLLVNTIYSTVRPDRRIAAFAAAGAQLVSFTFVAAIMSYLTVTSAFPLVDEYLAEADRALGLDWLAAFTWVKQRPIVDRLFGIFYGSSVAQIGALLIIFNVVGRLERCRELVWFYVITLLIIIPISWVIPAVGAWSYYSVANLTNAYHLPHFTALRAGTMSNIMLMEVNGLITFPSFHTALGVILVYVTRGISYVFPLFLLINALMIAATPTSGGHYFIDVFAGLVVVAFVIAAVRFVQRRSVALSSASEATAA